MADFLQQPTRNDLTTNETGRCYGMEMNVEKTKVIRIST
jgi:hypothetical protein